MKLDDICLVNAEVAASDAFYTDGLGLPRRMRNVRFVDYDFGVGPRLALWMGPSITETVGPAYPTAPGLPFRVTLEIPDAAELDAIAARLPEAVPLGNSATGAASLAVSDPDGFVTVLRAPAPGGRTRIAEVELAVSDPARTADFLERLGFEAMPSNPDGRIRFDGGEVTLMIRDASTLDDPALSPTERESFARTGGHLMLAVELETGEQVDALYADLTARGLAASGPPAVYEWGARSTYFIDPDGYIWEIYAWVETPR